MMIRNKMKFSNGADVHKRHSWYLFFKKRFDISLFFYIYIFYIYMQGSQMCWANIFFSLPIKIPPQIYLIAPFSPTTFVPKATFC